MPKLPTTSQAADFSQTKLQSDTVRGEEMLYARLQLGTMDPQRRHRHIVPVTIPPSLASLPALVHSSSRLPPTESYQTTHTNSPKRINNSYAQQHPTHPLPLQ